MAQKGLMRILSRKDGKGTVSDDKENEKVKFTKVLEFVPARKPELEPSSWKTSKCYAPELKTGEFAVVQMHALA